MTWSYVNQKSVSIGLTVYNQKVWVTKSASQLLFEGYQDDMIDMAREMPSFMGDTTVQVPFDRFGWFYMVGTPIYILSHVWRIFHPHRSHDRSATAPRT